MPQAALAIRDAAVLRALCTKDGWATYSPQVMQVLWTSTVLQIAYGYLAEMHRVVPHDFTPAEFRQYVTGVVGDESKLAEIEGLLGSMEQAPAIDNDVLREAVAQTVSRTLAMQAAKDIFKNHQRPDFVPAEALDLLSRSHDLVSRSSSTAISGYLDSEMPDPESDRPGRCSLFLSPKLDEALRGGPAAGEVVVFLAGPKKGKSSVIARVGAMNALAGMKVLDITLEISKEMRMRRYDSAYTGLDYDGLVANPHVVAGARRKVTEAGGDVTFVDWQYEEHSPSEILPIAKQYGPFDIIILDYLELMIPDQTKAYARKEQRHLLSKLGKDIRGIAKQLEIPIVTAWQVNRMGSREDQVTEQDISESWDIVKHVDAIIGISRNREEKKNKRLRIHTVLQRLSEKEASVTYEADLERMKLEEIV